jgi:phage shock protein PspC (stress-responsive transcriptional regulator)
VILQSMSDPVTHVSEVKRLERSNADRMLVGVAGGLGRYFDIHPAFFRVGFVVLTLLGGSGIVIYAAAALVMPAEGQADSFATRALRRRRDHPWPLIGLGIFGVAAAVLLSNASLWPQGDDIWFVLLVVGAAILWITRHGVADPASKEASSDAVTLAANGSRRGRRVLAWVGITIGAIVTLLVIAAAIFAAVFHLDPGSGIGEREHVPTTRAELDRSYELGIGGLRLDLSQLRLPAGETDLDARVDVGDLTVIVPADVALQARARVRAGSVWLFGERSEGWEVERRLRETGERVLALDARVGAGSIRIERAVP